MDGPSIRSHDSQTVTVRIKLTNVKAKRVRLLISRNQLHDVIIETQKDGYSQISGKKSHVDAGILWNDIHRVTLKLAWKCLAKALATYLMNRSRIQTRPNLPMDACRSITSFNNILL